MALNISDLRFGDELLKTGFAKMTKGGVIMDVTNGEQARIAETSGAVAVMALEKVPADIRAQGGVARMADPAKIREIIDSVTIPVMAKVRIGHITEALTLEAVGVDMLDESEVLTPADPYFHINKKQLKIPTVCGARNLPEAIRRIFEGAAMIRTKGEAGTGNIIEAVKHIRTVSEGIKMIKTMSNSDLSKVANAISDSYMTLKRETIVGLTQKETSPETTDVFFGTDLSKINDEILSILKDVKRMGRLPVVNFAAGGVATPADAALMMKMGMDGVFVGSGIFKSPDPIRMAKAIVDAVENYEDYRLIGNVSIGLPSMDGKNIEDIPKEQRLAERGI
ncbi:pyridoxal 5'-phosphate synthase lyase subunit PdxS [Cuniculiplasma sp. SKW3]|uniref:pyridoxal 5'-phosphate synthase lyase subunit PdxS n=1 Tax=unclassified Cuniculiplasma TaxID=2619706 RepID=UPI003FD54A46